MNENNTKVNAHYSWDKILSSVQKPTRYTGGEVNSIVKTGNEIRFGFCFPDTYEVGMSHLGMKILYHVLNLREDTWCERVFAPWVDMEDAMRKHNLPLFALESHQPIKDFDFLGFTLQYEMSYTNILNMLDLAGVPLLASQRGENDPLVCVGGPCAYNMEPLADFVDFAMMGEGEEIIGEVMDAYAQCRADSLSKDKFLERIAHIEGIYVPKFYDVLYNEDNTVKSITSNNENAPSTVKKRIIHDLDKVEYPDKFIVPFGEIVHDRIMVELFRGCIRGCRFCQAGYIYRPVREKNSDTLIDCSQKLLDSTGYEEISLSSLSTSDYTQLEQFTHDLINITEKEKVNLSLPSLRVDNFSVDLMEKVQKVRKSGLTFAPEAGTQRMRDVINKGVNEKDLLDSAALAINGGWSSIKLYFMIGLPTETDDDVLGIKDLAFKVVDVYNEIARQKNRIKPIRVTVSTSSFVPKAFTPFEFEPQDDRKTLMHKQDILKDTIRNKRIVYNWHDSKTSYLEGVFARGDRRLGRVILSAFEKGCRLDGWNEFFRYDTWLEAFAETQIDPDFYTARKREYTEIFPWEHIDIGVSKNHLIREHKNAMAAVVTPNCREKCVGCGAACFGADICQRENDGGQI